MESEFPGHKNANKNSFHKTFANEKPTIQKRVWADESFSEVEEYFLFIFQIYVNIYSNSGSMCPIDLEEVPGGGFYLPLRLLSFDWVAANANKERNKYKRKTVDNPLEMPDCDLMITFVSPQAFVYIDNFCAPFFKYVFLDKIL